MAAALHQLRRRAATMTLQRRGLPSIAWPEPGRVGIVGIGQLGRAVGGNLIRDGLRPVLHDRLGEDHCRDLLDRGATWAATPRELAEACDVVITGLPEPAHTAAAMGLDAEGAAADDGILAGLRPGSIWVEHGTTDPNATLRVREAVEARGAAAVAAPVTGGMQLLSAGKMVTLVGCDDEAAWSRVAPLVALSAPRIVRCGKFGHETVIKILTNMLCAVQDCAMGEAMMVAKKEGVDLKLLFDAMRVSSGNSFCWETEFARVVDETYYPDFTAKMMLKDIRLGQDIAARNDIPMLVHGLCAELYRTSIAKYGDDCGSTIPVRLVEDACRTRLSDDALKATFKDWTYTSEIDAGSYVIHHKNIDNPHTAWETTKAPEAAAPHS